MPSARNSATRFGNHAYAQTALEASRSAHDTAGDGETPAWLDFFNAGRLDGYSGFWHLGAGRPDDAGQALNRSLRTLTPTAVKQQTVILADLASARAACHRRAGSRCRSRGSVPFLCGRG